MQPHFELPVSPSLFRSILLSFALAHGLLWHSPLIKHREKVENAKSNPITGVMNHMCPPGDKPGQVPQKTTTAEQQP